MRKGEITRNTRETKIKIALNLDGEGKAEINTGIGFFDHMLELFACHSGFDLRVICDGDTKVDGHHTIEDIGIVLGKLFYDLIGDKKGIARYAGIYIPMDECLARCVVDISGRPFLVFKADLKGKTGEFDAELCEEFFRAFSSYSLSTVHLELLYGENTHHKAEAIFKAFAHALKAAVKIVGNSIPSSKGMIE